MSLSVDQMIYAFGQGTETPPLKRELLGGKGLGLCEMAAINLPVPPGFILTTDSCLHFRKEGRSLSASIKAAIQGAMSRLEGQMNAEFGGLNNPLLVSVRSGGRISMPGMMDTVLNLGLNELTVNAFAQAVENERLAYDNYRRLIMMYGEIVEGIDRSLFDRAFSTLKMQEGADLDIDLSVEGLQESCRIFQKIYLQEADKPFPQNVEEQLFGAISAVFNSWDSERAILYRQIYNIPDQWGTAVTVQTMVFGNKNAQSATGVAFTRDPATGEKVFYGEFLPNAQGEEVVAGIRTPQPINNHQKKNLDSSLHSLEELMPTVYCQLRDIVEKLEQNFCDMQDIEFTIDDGILYMLQTRSGKRTGMAAVRIAVEMLKEGLIDEKTALKRIDPEQLTQLLAPVFSEKEKLHAKKNCVAKGLNAGPGAASGVAVFSNEKAIEMKEKGIASILVREETSPDDFPGMVAAAGILTIRGGSTSHAAVVARGMGKPCVAGCDALHVNESKKTLSIGEHIIHEGDPLSIDGMSGEVYFCPLETSPSEVVQVLIEKSKKADESSIFQQFQAIMNLADQYRRLAVRTNADTPEDSIVARAFGAEGIGLCRTEHMFMDSARLHDVRRLLFSSNSSDRTQAIERLLPYQKADFIGIFKAMNGLPVTIRLLDPPLHEFMPHNDEELAALADMMHLPLSKLLEMKSAMEEVNPMLGHRGCRLGILFPELTSMQVRAILEAALEVKAEGYTVLPEIMVPLVGVDKELFHQRALIEKTAKELFEEKQQNLNYLIGTMIELPRSALTADEIARFADFFSFGTNDLTQTTFGISRDDGNKFIPAYTRGVENPLQNSDPIKIFEADPFQVLDQKGVGLLMDIAINKGKSIHKQLKLGICGEHGGEPSSVNFCHNLGMDYVSCSPYRIPIARLAAAQANLS